MPLFVSAVCDFRRNIALSWAAGSLTDLRTFCSEKSLLPERPYLTGLIFCVGCAALPRPSLVIVRQARSWRRAAYKLIILPLEDVGEAWLVGGLEGEAQLLLRMVTSDHLERGAGVRALLVACGSADCTWTAGSRVMGECGCDLRLWRRVVRRRGTKVGQGRDAPFRADSAGTSCYRRIITYLV